MMDRNLILLLLFILFLFFFSFFYHLFAPQQPPKPSHTKYAFTTCSSKMVTTTGPTESVTPEAGTGIVFWLETEEIEAAVEKAVKAGTVAEGELTDGKGACDTAAGRVGKVKDQSTLLFITCEVVTEAQIINTQINKQVCKDEINDFDVWIQ